MKGAYPHATGDSNNKKDIGSKIERQIERDWGEMTRVKFWAIPNEMSAANTSCVSKNFIRFSATVLF